MQGPTWQSIVDVFGSWGASQKVTLVALMYSFVLTVWHALLPNMLVPVLDVSCSVEYNTTVDGITHLVADSQNYTFEEEYSLTAKFNLGCNRKWLISLAKSSFMISSLVASSFVGRMSDRYGRKRALLWFTVPGVIGNVVILLAQNYAMFFAGLLLNGASFGVLITPLSVLFAEMTGNQRRSFLGSLTTFGGISGSLFLGSVGLATRYWLHIQIAGLCLSLLFLPLVWYIQESPLWLIINNKQKEALDCIEVLCKRNGQAVPQNLSHLVETFAKEEIRKRRSGKLYGFRDLLCTPEMARRTCLAMFLRFAITLLFYGVTFNVSLFSSNVCLSMVIASSAALPFSTIAVLMVRKLGLKLTLSTAALGATLAFFTSAITTALGCSSEVVRATMLVLCWGFIQVCLDFSIQTVSEIFPTVVRGTASALGFLLSRVAGCIAAYTQILSQATSSSSPFYIFGAIAMLCFVCCVLLPDTKGQNLDHAVQDVETGKKAKPERNYFLWTKVRVFTIS